MGKYILCENIALRAWTDRPFCYVKRGVTKPFPVSKSNFSVLLDCDGKTEIEDHAVSETFFSDGVIRKSNGTDTLSPWQEYRFYSHSIIYAMELELTERCNYNCRHCFNAESSDIPRNELSIDEIRRILAEATDSGIFNIMLTGGEPMLHPHFKETVKAIADAGMYLYAINTNGYYINEEILSYMESCSFKPKMKISYDGKGFHDWMRGRKGAEEKTLSAIRLCRRMGFPVMIQMNINKRNLDVMKESIDLLDAEEVHSIRIIRTTEAPRWIENAGGDSLSWEEYYDAALELTAYYISRERKCNLDFWECMYINEKKKCFSADKIRHFNADTKKDRYICHGRVDICANGQLYPCMQMSGGFKSKNICLGDTKRQSLSDILCDSPYSRLADTTVREKAEGNNRCNNCPFFRYCGGGCPAISLILHGNYFGPDDAACIFFRDGYYEKFKNLLKGYTDKKPLPSDIDTSYLKNFDYSTGSFLDIKPENYA